MTEEPPPQPMPEVKRPGILAVFAILSMVFGGYGLICSPFALIIPIMSETLPTAAQNEPIYDMTYGAWFYISVVLGWIASGFLLAIGIGLFRMKEWARKATLYYAGYTIIMAFAGIIDLTLSFSDLMDSMSSGQTPAFIGGIIGGMIGFFISLAFPITQAIIMAKNKDVIAVCK